MKKWKKAAPRPVEFENSLAARCPDVAAQLHPTRNPPGTDAAKITLSSNKPLWWQCTKDGAPDHVWEETPNRRTAKGRRVGGEPGRCPFCANFRVSVTNSLANVRPDLAAQWHATKNGDLTPADVTFMTTRMVWWQDKNGNEWPAQVRWRTTQAGRNPYDTGHRLAPSRSLAALFPHLVREWAQDLNGDLTPDRVAAYSLEMVMWRDPDSNDPPWPATPADRVRGRGSPFVHGHKVSQANNLLTVAPEIAREWSDKNGAMTPTAITAHSSRPVWWCCQACQFHWPATPKNRMSGTGCPRCNEQGLSRAQHRVTWELRFCFPELPRERTRIRCERVPVNGQRMRREREIDILIPSLGVALEYDGVYWHRDPRKIADDIRKNQELKAANLRVLRVRETGLPLLTADDIEISVDGGNTEPHVVAAAVVRRLLEWGCEVPRGLEYLAAGRPLMAAEAAADWAARKVSAGKKKSKS